MPRSAMLSRQFHQGLVWCGNATKASQGLTGSQAELDTKSNELKVTLGTILEPAFISLNKRLAETASWFNGVLKGLTGTGVDSVCMPSVGGDGVTEFGLTLGLTSVGVDQSAAFAIVVLYRLSTFYLPPTWGFCALGWLKRNSYL